MNDANTQKLCIMWSFYGSSSRYESMLQMSVDSAKKFSPNIDRHVIVENDVKVKDCFIEKRRFAGGPASRMSLRYLYAAELLTSYDHVLHVDVDCLIAKDISSIYVSKGKGISLASESSTNKNHFDASEKQVSFITEICWAGPLLSSEDIIKYKDTPSICMGVWLADKDDSQTLLNMYEDVVKFENMGFRGMCLDQHAANRRLLIDSAWNLNLQDHVTHSGNKINNLEDFSRFLSSTQSIAHFAGGVSDNHEKFTKMTTVFNLLRDRND